MHFYKDSDIREIKKLIIDKGLKPEDFHYSEGSAPDNVTPPLFLKYKPSQFQFTAKYNQAYRKYEFEFNPNARNNKIQKLSSTKKGEDFRLILDFAKSWLGYVKEEVDANNDLLENLFKNAGPLKDETVYAAEVIEDDKLLSNEEKELFAKAFDTFIDKFRIEVAFNLKLDGRTIDKLSEIEKQVAEIKEEIRKSTKTRNQLKGLLQRFVEVVIFGIILEAGQREAAKNIFITIFQPIWNGVLNLISGGASK